MGCNDLADAQPATPFGLSDSRAIRPECGDLGVSRAHLRRPARLALPGAVCATLLVSIWIGSLAHHRGLVRYDSNYYLRQAAFFVDGLGVESWGHVEPAAFTVWPLGYPAATALAASLTGMSVFWAAKLVNSAALLLSVLLLVRHLPQTGATASLAFLSAGMFHIYSSTFAEGLFMLAVLIATLSLTRMFLRPSGYTMVALAMAVGAATSIRYVGVVLVGPIVLAMTWAAVRGQYRTARWLAGAAAGASSLIVAYLLLNQWLSGALLPPNSPRRASLLTFAYDSMKGFVSEANFVFLYIPNPRDPGMLAAFGLVLVTTLAVAIHVWHRGRCAGRGFAQLDPDERTTIAGLAFMGVFLWAAMVVLKFRFYFSPLEFRYLGPGTLLVSAAVLSGLAAYGLREYRGAKTALALIVVSAVAWHGLYGPWQGYRANGRLFTQQMERIVARYRPVPPGSVVLRGSLHLLFLRPDLLVVPQENIRTSAAANRLRREAIETGRPVWVEQDGHPIPVGLVPE